VIGESEVKGYGQGRANVQGILVATAPHTGDEFFRSLTAAISVACGVSIAFVSELLVDMERARMIAICVDGEPVTPFEYALTGTPCEEAVAKQRAVYARGVQLRFPNDALLAELRGEAYVGCLLRSASGDPLGLVGITHDSPLTDADSILTLLEELAPRVAAELERRQVENALRRSEARFRLLSEHSHDILFYYRVLPAPQFEYISPAIDEIVGLPSEAFLANPDLAVQLVEEQYRPQVRSAMSTESEEPVVVRLQRPDGGFRWLEFRNFPFRDNENRLSAIGGTIRDISRRVEAEESLRLSEQYRRALLAAMPDTLFRLSSDGEILDFVGGETVIDELPPARAAIGRNIRDLLPVFMQVRRLIHTSLRERRMQRLEFEVPSAGDSIYYEARCVPFGSDEVLLILRDFTAIKWHEAEEERRRLRDELDQRVEERIRTNPYSLTYRELAILHLVADGAADKQIAESLGISTYTVNKHVGNILGKMNASSRTEAGVRAIRERLLG
jgi:PAS domain S-box-containing protein